MWLGFNDHWLSVKIWSIWLCFNIYFKCCQMNLLESILRMLYSQPTWGPHCKPWSRHTSIIFILTMQPYTCSWTGCTFSFLTQGELPTVVFSKPFYSLSDENKNKGWFDSIQDLRIWVLMLGFKKMWQAYLGILVLHQFSSVSFWCYAGYCHRDTDLECIDVGLSSMELAPLQDVLRVLGQSFWSG